MQQDKQLMDSLLENQKTVNYISEEDLNPESNQITEIRVVNAKYKVYVIILIILATIVGTTYLPDAKAKYDGAIAAHQNKEAQLANLKQTFSQYSQIETARKQVDTEKVTNNIIRCVNDSSKDEKDECINKIFSWDLAILSWQLNTVVSYLQMGTLDSEKMKIDEKKVLKNLDRYLTRNTPGEALSVQNGTIWGIQIWEPKVVKHIEIWEGNEKRAFNLNSAPIEAEIVFENKDDLITFVDNIEQYIITEKEDRILYTIDEVSYDIMQYDEKQSTKVSLTAYYFK